MNAAEVGVQIAIGDAIARPLKGKAGAHQARKKLQRKLGPLDEGGAFWSSMDPIGADRLIHVSG
jgi:hypothetical protein